MRKIFKNFILKYIRPRHKYDTLTEIRLNSSAFLIPYYIQTNNFLLLLVTLQDSEPLDKVVSPLSCPRSRNILNSEVLSR